MARQICYRCKGSVTQSYGVRCLVCDGSGYSSKKPIIELGIGDRFRYNNQLWVVDQKMNDNHVHATEVYHGEVVYFYYSTPVSPWPFPERAVNERFFTVPSIEFKVWDGIFSTLITMCFGVNTKLYTERLALYRELLIDSQAKVNITKLASFILNLLKKEDSNTLAQVRDSLEIWRK